MPNYSWESIWRISLPYSTRKKKQKNNLNLYFWKISLIFSSKLINRYKAISFSIKNISFSPHRAGQVYYKVDLEQLISKNSQGNLRWKGNEQRVLLLNFFMMVLWPPTSPKERHLDIFCRVMESHRIIYKAVVPNQSKSLKWNYHLHKIQ